VTGAGERDLQELAAAYALGALDPAEARAFEAFLAASPEANREVAEYHEVGALLALSAAGATTATPSPALRDRVLARARAETQPARPRSFSWMAWTALAASLAAAAALAWQQQALRRSLAARDSTIAALTETLAAREERLRQREASLNFILEPAVTLTNLVTTRVPAPGVQFFWNRQTNQAIVHASSLTPAAADRAYQLWFIPRDGKPIPSVTFNSEPSGHALVERIEVPAGAELTAAAITEEPAGGSPQPTTPILVLGTLATGRS
jgi:anti-sigma-K factor RskA